MMLSAFAEAGRYLHVTKYVKVAICNAEFLLEHLSKDNRLYRSWRAGKTLHRAYLEDYSALGLALLDLYQSDPQTHWYTAARNIAIYLQSLFLDQNGGFFDTAIDHESLITRPKNIQDNATPCGSSLTANLLLRLSSLTGIQEWRTTAETMLLNIANISIRFPTAFAHWLSALDFSMHPVHEIAILGGAHDHRTRSLIDCLWSGYNPSLIAAISEYPPGKDAPELLQNRTLINGLPTAYVCQNLSCKLPVNTASDLLTQLR
jgi:hypothetical protein